MLHNALTDPGLPALASNDDSSARCEYYRDTITTIKRSTHLVLGIISHHQRLCFIAGIINISSHKNTIQYAHQSPSHIAIPICNYEEPQRDPH
ncbi:predicted protein [Lichtheimia corymbifera JMRC:FSU:9682]|uniref:Uncharacterized protein n=1 Tax=Lichtheimia corymbifera JMRC:FSU:9682 TaxID=1263082 RepID=A0A068SET6_9FUNG|nr:predicted protein [Lichtheimia corymbifera JMRC:FSU:9682]